MLQITIPEREMFNELTNTFSTHKAFTLQLEHSLISLSRWESKWKKSFLSNKEPLTRDELIDYVRCMDTKQNTDPKAFEYLGLAELQQIQDYISDPRTATTIYDRRNIRHRQETITSELIYYWMINCGIPMECEKWHLNRLLTLIRVCNIKQGPEKKMSRQSIYQQNRELNAARRARMHSRG